MPTGYTTTDALADSLPTVIARARIVREQVGVMTSPRVVDLQQLGSGNGLSWKEIDMAKLTAASINQLTDMDDNPQQLSDSIRTITPSQVGIHTLITDQTAAKISANAFAQTGSLAQNAIQRKKDADGLAVFAGASTTLAAAGSALTTGHIGAGARRITSNTTEPGSPPINMVHHGFVIKDIEDEIVQGVNPTTAPEQLLSGGLSEAVYQDFFRGMIRGAQVFEDGNITIDSGDDARGAVFAREAIVLVQGVAPRAVAVRKENIGGGATSIYIYDDFAYGERTSVWLYALLNDAATPTS
jgi:hypothetical protein